MSNVWPRTAAPQWYERLHVCVYVLTEIYRTCEQPTRRAKQRNHIDPEPYTRHRRRVRINKDFPSRASNRTGEYFKHPLRRPFSCTPPTLSITTLTGLLASYISFPRLSSFPAACCLFALLLSRREKHFLSTVPARISWTRAVNFSFPSPYKSFSFSSFLFVLLLRLYRCPCSFFPRSHTFYVVFPDMSREHEYVNPGLGS